MRRKEDLHPHPLQLQQHFDNHAEHLRVQVGLRLIPEKYGTIAQSAVPYQQPKEAELAPALR